jgi:hypothetical protein
MSMKKIAAIVGIAVVIAVIMILVSASVFYKRYEAKQAHVRLEQQAAERIWQESLARFQRDVRTGTPRSEVKGYLDAQKTIYSDGHDILVKLGEEPGDGFTCDRWTGYAQFEFGHDRAADPAPQDALTTITLQRIGHCL